MALKAFPNVLCFEKVKSFMRIMPNQKVCVMKHGKQSINMYSPWHMEMVINSSIMAIG